LILIQTQPSDFKVNYDAWVSHGSRLGSQNTHKMQLPPPLKKIPNKQTKLPLQKSI